MFDVTKLDLDLAPDLVATDLDDEVGAHVASVVHGGIGGRLQHRDAALAQDCRDSLERQVEVLLEVQRSIMSSPALVSHLLLPCPVKPCYSVPCS